MTIGSKRNFRKKPSISQWRWVMYQWVGNGKRYCLYLGWILVFILVCGDAAYHFVVVTLSDGKVTTEKVLVSE